MIRRFTLKRSDLMKVFSLMLDMTHTFNKSKVSRYKRHTLFYMGADIWSEEGSTLATVELSFESKGYPTVHGFALFPDADHRKLLRKLTKYNVNHHEDRSGEPQTKNTAQLP